jgi:hypothetical protein
MRILYLSAADSATLTASTEASNLPVENVQDPRLSQPWRTTALSDQTVLIDAGDGNTINPNCFALAGHNLTDGCTLKIQGNATDAWTTPTVDETVTHRDDVIVHFFTGSALRYWRVFIDDDSNPDGYVQIGRLMLGTYLQMPPVDPAVNIPRRTTSVTTDSISGQSYGDRGVLYRAPGFQFPLITDAERVLIDAMWTEVENVAPVVLVVWEDSLTVLGPIYCKLDQDNLPWQRAAGQGLSWQTTIAFREVF